MNQFELKRCGVCECGCDLYMDEVKNGMCEWQELVLEIIASKYEPETTTKRRLTPPVVVKKKRLSPPIIVSGIKRRRILLVEDGQ